MNKRILILLFSIFVPYCVMGMHLDRQAIKSGVKYTLKRLGENIDLIVENKKEVETVLTLFNGKLNKDILLQYLEALNAYIPFENLPIDNGVLDLRPWENIICESYNLVLKKNLQEVEIPNSRQNNLKPKKVIPNKFELFVGVITLLGLGGLSGWFLNSWLSAR